jgi:hypothetical protein
MNPAGVALTDLWVVVALGVTTLVLLTTWACRRLPAARFQRGAWLTCLVAVIGLVAGELFGVGAGLALVTRDVCSRAVACAAWLRATPQQAGRPAGSERSLPPHDAPVSHHRKPQLANPSAEWNTVRDGVSQGHPVRRDGVALLGSEEFSRRLAALWLVVAGVLCGRLVVRHLLLAVFVARHDRSTCHPLARRITTIAARLGLQQTVAVLEARCIDSPIALGLVRPTIGLPADFGSRYAAGEQDVMLAHELAHLAGRDPCWRLLSDVVAACLWWHPGAWWMRSRLIEASESVADEASLLSSAGPETLAACLVRLAREGLGGRELGWLGMAGERFRSGLGRRVGRLMALADAGSRRPAGVSWTRLATGAAVVVSVPVVFVFTAAARSQPPITGAVDMRVIDATYRRSVAGGMLAAVFAGQVQAGGPVAGADSVASQAGAGAGAANDESAGDPPAQEEPTTGQAKGQARPKTQLPKKQPPKPRALPAAQQRPRGPAGKGTPERMQAMAAEMSERMMAGMTVEKRAALGLPVGVAEGYLKEMEGEILRIRQELHRRGDQVGMASSSGPGHFIRTMTVRPTTGSTPVGKAALLERIRGTFVTDVRRFDTGMLSFGIREHANSARIVVRKHPDRVVSLLDDEGQWTLQINRLDGRSIHKGVVKDHVDGSDVPPAHLQDFRYAAEILAIPLDDYGAHKEAHSHPALRDFWGRYPGR